MSKLKLKKGGEAIWRKWCEEIKKREKEALATLRKETVKIETCFTDGEYIYILMIADSFETADSSVKKEPHPIDLEQDL